MRLAIEQRATIRSERAPFLPLHGLGRRQQREQQQKQSSRAGEEASHAGFHGRLLRRYAVSASTDAPIGSFDLTYYRQTVVFCSTILGTAAMRSIPYPHPGEILQEEFLTPFGLTQYRLAKSIEVNQTRISEILAGRRSITADTALRLARFFGTSEGFWMNLQMSHDAASARDELADVLARIKPYSPKS